MGTGTDHRSTKAVCLNKCPSSKRHGRGECEVRISKVCIIIYYHILLYHKTSC